MRWMRRIRLTREGLNLDADVNLALDMSVHHGSASPAGSTRQMKGDRMSEESGFKPLSREELERLAGEELPERAAMSLINANVAIPINAAIAANVLSDNATSLAEAAQTGQIAALGHHDDHDQHHDYDDELKLSPAAQPGGSGAR